MKKLLATVFIVLLCSPVFAGQHKHNCKHHGKTYQEVMTKKYCTSGESGQEVSSCLKEVKNSKKEKFSEMSAHYYKENMMKRCAEFSDSDKELCESRLKYGNKMGSVKEGGTITELTAKETDSMNDSNLNPPEARKNQWFELEK